MPPVQDIYSDLAWRGLIHQSTADEQLPGWLNDDSRTLYAGFDPSADSLHVGSLLPVMMLRRFQRAGHRPIALVGGATGMIGDPSGKSEERNLLSPEVLQHNIEGVQQQLCSFLDFDCGESPAICVNNFEWMRNFSYLEFLRDVGKNFPVNVMLGKDSVKSRLERTDGGISYTEFSYMLLQAYDFVHLNEHFDCQLQIGGSDQWGNITSGIDLARRMRGVHLYGITCPLLTKSDGSKMGKTESGSVWLDAKRTSPFQFYQYWFNIEDDETGVCLRFLTELDRDEIVDLDQRRQDRPGARDSQRRLAEELTRIVHGEQALDAAQRASQVLYGAAIETSTDAQLQDIFPDVPSKTMNRDRLSGQGLNIIEALMEAGLANSKSDARRLIAQGGAYVNNRRRDGIETQPSIADLASESIMVLRAGKKKYALLRFASAKKVD